MGSNDRPYISMYCSPGILLRRLFMICFWVSSSTSMPRGALATKSTSATWNSSRRMSSPPRSPSTKAVMTLSLDRSEMVRGMLVPSTAMAFLMPDLEEVEDVGATLDHYDGIAVWTLGPAGRWSLPKWTISST